MATLRQIKRRIRSIQSTAKITKAMEMIAASKMKRAQERGLAGRPYDQRIRQVLANIAAAHPTESDMHPLLERREVHKIAVIHITADRGLCGGLNTNMNRKTSAFILEQKIPVNLITVGRKGRDFMVRFGQKVRAEFTGLGDKPGMLDIGPIARIVMDDYTNKEVDMVYVAYPQFITTVTQRPVLQQLLPVQPAEFPRGQNVEYIFEPDPHFVMVQLLPRFVEMEIYHAILEAIASEQSARMVAMRNASDNANELITDLTLAYNKARQELITKELLDMAGAAAALA